MPSTARDPVVYDLDDCAGQIGYAAACWHSSGGSVRGEQWYTTVSKWRAWQNRAINLMVMEALDDEMDLSDRRTEGRIMRHCCPSKMISAINTRIRYRLHAHDKRMLEDTHTKMGVKRGADARWYEPEDRYLSFCRLFLGWQQKRWRDARTRYVDKNRATINKRRRKNG